MRLRCSGLGILATSSAGLVWCSGLGSLAKGNAGFSYSETVYGTGGSGEPPVPVNGDKEISYLVGSRMQQLFHAQVSMYRLLGAGLGKLG